jgi:predicted GNAT family acetyltransferase
MDTPFCGERKSLREEIVLQHHKESNMKLIRYDNAVDFLKEAQCYLEINEAANNIILGSCLRLANNKNDAEKQPCFATIKDERGLLLAAMLTPPFPITIYSHNLECSKELELIVNDLIEEKWEVSGVIAPVKLSKTFADLWTKKTNSVLIEGLNMRAYELEKVNNVPIITGKFRVAKEEDLEIISKWIVDMEAEEGSNISAERAMEITEDKIKDKQLFIWEDKSPVSMACTARPTANGIVVNMVYTPKEFRKRGYATSCVAALSEYLLHQGYKFCSLFTDLSNPTSNDIYIKIGYKAICDFKGYKFR